MGNVEGRGSRFAYLAGNDNNGNLTPPRERTTLEKLQNMYNKKQSNSSDPTKPTSDQISSLRRNLHGE